MDQLVDMILSGKKSGVPAIDAQVADALEESRMALPVEREEGFKAKRDPKGSRMITPSERDGLAKRQKVLKRMSRPIKEVGSEAAEKVGKVGLKRAASVLGPVAAGLMEMSDVEAAGEAETPEKLAEKKALGNYAKSQAVMDKIKAQGGSDLEKEAAIRGLIERMRSSTRERGKSLVEEGGDPVDQDLMRRVREISKPSNEEEATDKAMERISPQDQHKIMRQLIEAKKAGM